MKNNCPECNGSGISYVNHSLPVNHAYRIDHMNAHICKQCGGSGKVSHPITADIPLV